MFGTLMLPLLYAVATLLPATAVWGWVLVIGVTVLRGTLCRTPPGITSEPPVHLQSSRHSEECKSCQFCHQHLRGVTQCLAHLLADTPAIHRDPLRSQITDCQYGGEGREILFIPADWKGGTDSLAYRLWKERTSCGGWCFLVLCSCQLFYS